MSTSEQVGLTCLGDACQCSPCYAVCGSAVLAMQSIPVQPGLHSLCSPIVSFFFKVALSFLLFYHMHITRALAMYEGIKSWITHALKSRADCMNCEVVIS